MPIDPNDWVIAINQLNNGIVVGAREWDTSTCGEGICDVPAMGYNGSESTVGYMLSGDTPSFVIYDTSSNMYYLATSSESVDGWSNNSFFMNDSLKAFSE